MSLDRIRYDAGRKSDPEVDNYRINNLVIDGMNSTLLFTNTYSVNINLTLRDQNGAGVPIPNVPFTFNRVGNIVVMNAVFGPAGNASSGENGNALTGTLTTLPIDMMPSKSWTVGWNVQFHQGTNTWTNAQIAVQNANQTNNQTITINIGGANVGGGGINVNAGQPWGPEGVVSLMWIAQTP